MPGRIVDRRVSKGELTVHSSQFSVSGRGRRLPRRVTTITPENVRIDYELAGIASRTGAAVTDLLIQSAVILIAVTAFFALQLWLRFSIVGWPTAVLIVLGFLLWWGYFVFFETRWNGQTPGKRLLRLRVVRYGGMPVDFPCAAIRGLIRTIDLALFLIGVVFMLITPKSQRLGDLAAGTLVVKERSEWQGHLDRPKPTASPDGPEAGLVRNIELVTPEQFGALSRFVERAAELEPGVREEIAAKIAQPLMLHLGIENGAGIVYSNLLTAIHERCSHERGMR